MTKLNWGQTGQKFFEAGVDRGVLYPKGSAGVSWSGLISVAESPTGGEAQPYYMDGIKHQNRASGEEWAGSLEAFNYPPEFAMCDGTAEIYDGLFAAHQRRQSFGLSYRTMIGSDLEQDLGYKIHIIYNVLAAPSQKANETLRADPDPQAFSWDLTAKPVYVQGLRPTAHLIIDSTKSRPSALAAIEDFLYGTGSTDPVLPQPIDILALYSSSQPDAPFVVTFLGDDIYQISGSDSAVHFVDDNHFQLSSSFVIDHGDGSYTATSGEEIDPDGPDVPFTVEDLGNDLYKITGPDDEVYMVDEDHFGLSSPFVTDHGDGTFDATSA